MVVMVILFLMNILITYFVFAQRMVKIIIIDTLSTNLGEAESGKICQKQSCFIPKFYHD
jgi:hypothetical protein